MLESTVTKKIRKGLTWSVKLAGGGFQTLGLPDVLGVLGGCTVYLEIKLCQRSLQEDRDARGLSKLLVTYQFLKLSPGQNATLRLIDSAYQKNVTVRVGVLRVLMGRREVTIQFWTPGDEDGTMWYLNTEINWNKLPVFTPEILRTLLALPTVSS